MTTAYLAARSFATKAQHEIGPSDLSREFRIGWNRACGLLEELEADRLLGSLQVGGGVRRWHASFPVDEARVEMLRKAARRTA